jgi:hypothetical protein
MKGTETSVRHRFAGSTRLRQIAEFQCDFIRRAFGPKSKVRFQTNGWLPVVTTALLVGSRRARWDVRVWHAAKPGCPLHGRDRG